MLQFEIDNLTANGPVHQMEEFPDSSAASIDAVIDSKNFRYQFGALIRSALAIRQFWLIMERLDFPVIALEDRPFHPDSGIHMPPHRYLILFVYAFILTPIISAPTPSFGQGRQLSPEGEARRSAHSYLLGEYSAGKKTTLKGQGSAEILDEIEIISKPVLVRGDVLIDLPPGSERVASMFRYIVLRGEGLDNLEDINMLPYAPKSSLAVSTKSANIYRVKVAAMPIPSKSMPAIQLRTKCKPGTTAKIASIAFNSQSKLSTTFDDIAFRNLGAEYPRTPVDITIDLDHELSIDGHVDLEREKFCRYYATPGSIHRSYETWAAERNFLPGRQIFKLQPSLVVGYSSNQPKLSENKSKPGAADFTFFDRYDSAGNRPKAIEPFRNIKYAMCFDDYPEFMSVKQVGRGTPLIEHFNDAAQLAGAYVADQIKDGGGSAEYWEVKNESTIKAEWDYHWKKQYDSWGLMADFHNRVAKEVRKVAPDTKVGGPSSAWMQVQVNNFGLYNNQRKFMDLTKGQLDFYSHHFYEDFGTVGAWERREGKYSNYLLGRMEAILDMFQSHMHQTNNIKPILITECGSLQPGRGPTDYWLRIRSYSAYMHKMMKRPDQIELGVPFVFLTIPWNPKSGDTAFIPKAGKPNFSPLKDTDSTPVKYFFELWRNFDGRRLPVSTKQPWLDVTAVHRDNLLQLAVTNMGGRRLDLNIKSLLGELPIKSVSQRRLYFLDGEVKYEDDVVHQDLTQIPVDVEETTLITIHLTQPLEIAGQIIQKKWFAAGTAVPSEEAAKKGFFVKIDDPESIRSAKAIVGVSRTGGLGGPLKGTFNGKPFHMEAEWASEFNNLFAPIEIKIPNDLLKEDNQLIIAPREGLTITSVHIVTTQ